MKPTLKSKATIMLEHPCHFIAQGLGTGLSPIMPGTVGTLFGWLCFVSFNARWSAVFTEGVWASIIVVGFVFGVWACQKTGEALDSLDDGSMVWDEIIAIWLVLWVLGPSSWQTQAWAVCLFRILDITKPPPIRYIERHVKGGLGVMFDDIVAAFYTLFLFAAWRSIGTMLF